jgi:hypothetical protein
MMYHVGRCYERLGSESGRSCARQNEGHGRQNLIQFIAKLAFERDGQRSPWAP